MKAKGGKGGSKMAQERQQTQAHGAGRRDERQRLADGGGSGRRLVGRCFAPGKELGSGCKLRRLQRGTAMDGEEVGKRGERTIQKTGKEKGGEGDR